MTSTGAWVLGWWFFHDRHSLPQRDYFPLLFSRNQNSLAVVFDAVSTSLVFDLSTYLIAAIRTSTQISMNGLERFYIWDASA